MYHIIINPASKSGRGRKIWNELVPILEQHKIAYTAYFTAGIGDASMLAERITSDSLENTVRLIVLGGDGTMNEVLQGICSFDTAVLAYIPTGSSNDLARDLGIAGSPADALLHILHNATPVRMDIGMLTYESYESDLPVRTRYFHVGAGIGFDAAVCQEALHSSIKDICNRLGLGKLTYLGIALKQLLAAKSVSCKITLDENEPIRLPRFLFIASMVHRYEGGGFMFCPSADCRDGLLDICIVGPMSKLKLLRILPTAFSGNHTRFRNVFMYRAKTVRIRTSAPLWVQTDGEVATRADGITITCLQEKLQMML